MFRITQQKEVGKLQKGDFLEFDNHIGAATFEYAVSPSEIVVKNNIQSYRIQGLLLPGARLG
jgi:hypothetical protein